MAADWCAKARRGFDEGEVVWYGIGVNSGRREAYFCWVARKMDSVSNKR